MKAKDTSVEVSRTLTLRGRHPLSYLLEMVSSLKREMDGYVCADASVKIYSYDVDHADVVCSYHRDLTESEIQARLDEDVVKRKDALDLRAKRARDKRQAEVELYRKLKKKFGRKPRPDD